MPYLLNKSAGANFKHPEIGTVPPLTAIEIDDRLARTLKNRIGAVVFKEVIKLEKHKKQETPEKESDEVPLDLGIEEETKLDEQDKEDGDIEGVEDGSNIS